MALNGARESGRGGSAERRDGERIPAAAAWLGGLGAVPFAAAALAMWFAPEPWRAVAMSGIVAYGAVILSFLGGLIWGAVCGASAAAGAPWSAGNTRLLVLSVVPALVGWAATFLPAPYPLPAMAVAVLAVLFIDRRLASANIVPGWWMNLRWRLSGTVAALLVAATAGSGAIAMP